MGSLVGGLVTAGHAADDLSSSSSSSSANSSAGTSHGFKHFFKHLFSGSPSVAPAETAAPAVVKVAPDAVAPVFVTPDLTTPGTDTDDGESEAASVKRYAPLSSANSYDACSSMSDGETRIVDSQNTPNNLKALNAKYMLSKTTDARSGKVAYEAALNIQFTPKPGESAGIVDVISAQARTCYAAMHLQSEQGEALNLRLADPSEQIPVTHVSVSSQPMARIVSEDAFDWTTQADCATMFHESLHLLGLVDLYSEPQMKSPNGQLAWDCRSTAPESIMNSLNYARLSSVAYQRTSCSCETRTCARALDEISGTPTECPSSAETSQFVIGIRQLDIDTDAHTKALFESQYAPLLKGKREDQWTYSFLTAVASSKQALYPAEFRAITHPGCKSNSVYYQCSKNAYLTSTAHGGSGCETPVLTCNDPAVWLQ